MLHKHAEVIEEWLPAKIFLKSLKILFEPEAVAIQLPKF